MTVAQQQDTPAVIRAKAEAWFKRQCEISALSLGNKWPEHREWVEAYLRQEIRERLIARGWRPKR
ncbi:hypothetical protein [Polaromonas sp. JS666]|uniref:hypothetical protein n=1 Tax=Polaromonas sp. (strain JS666 / ATCC BAA-500) TaxID=296591 RepID=UPI00059CD33D|nr:hypothetical protein [Polaromonas sp. JS666]